MIFSGSSKGTHTAPDEILKVTNIQFIVFVVSIIIFVSVFFLAHLSQMLIGELIGYSCPSSSVRPSSVRQHF